MDPAKREQLKAMGQRALEDFRKKRSARRGRKPQKGRAGGGGHLVEVPELDGLPGVAEAAEADSPERSSSVSSSNGHEHVLKTGVNPVEEHIKKEPIGAPCGGGDNPPVPESWEEIEDQFHTDGTVDSPGDRSVVEVEEDDAPVQRYGGYHTSGSEGLDDYHSGKLELLEDRIRDLQEELLGAREQIGSLENQLASSQKSADSRSQQLQQIQEVMQQLEEQVQELELENTSLKATVESGEERVQELETELVSTHTRNEDIMKDLKVSMFKVSSLQQANEAANKRQEDREMYIKLLQDKVQDLKNENERFRDDQEKQGALLEATLKENSEQFQDLQHEYEELKATLTNKEVDLKSNDAELQEAKKLFQDLQVENERLTTALENEKKLSCEKQTTLSATLKQLQQLQEEQIALKSGFENEKATLTDRSKDLGSELVKLQAENRNLWDSLSNFKTDIDRRAADLGSMKDQLHSLEMELQEARTKNVDLEEQIEISQQSTEHLYDKLQQLKADNDRLSTEVEEKQAAFDAELIARRDAENRIKELEKRQQNAGKEADEKLTMVQELAASRADQLQRVQEMMQQLTERVQELEMENSNLDTELRQKVDLLQSKAAELSVVRRHVHDLEGQASRHQVHMEDLECAFQAKCDIANEQCVALEESNSKILGLEDKLKEMMEQSRSLSQEAEITNDALKLYTLQNAEALTKVADLEGQVLELEAEKAEIVNAKDRELSNLEKQVQASKDETETMRGKLRAAVKKGKRIEEEKQRLESEIKVIQEQFNASALSAETEAIQRRNKELEDDLNNFAGQISTLQNQLAEVTRARDNQQAELKQLKAKFSQVSKASAAFEAQVKELTGTEIPQLKQRTQQSDDQIIVLTDQVAKLKGAIEDRDELEKIAKKERDELESMLATSASQNETLQNEVVNLKQEASKAQEMFSQIDTYADRAERAEQKLQQNETEFVSMRDEVLLHRNKVAMAREAIEKLRNERQQALLQVEELTDRVGQLETANTKLEEMCSSRSKSSQETVSRDVSVAADVNAWVHRAQQAEKRVQEVEHDALVKLGDMSAKLADAQRGEQSASSKVLVLEEEAARYHAEMERLQRAHTESTSKSHELSGRLQAEVDILKQQKQQLEEQLLQQREQPAGSPSHVALDIMTPRERKDQVQGSITQSLKRREIADLEGIQQTGDDLDSDSEKGMEFRPLTSLNFVQAASSHPRIGQVVAKLDHWSVSAGRFLTGKPIFRLILAAYAAVLHLILFLCLLL